MTADFGKQVRGRLRTMGWAFLIITVALLLSSLNTGTNLLYLVLGGLVSLVVLSLVLSRVSLARLVVTRDAPHAVHRGETFISQVRVENRKRFQPSVSVRIESGAEPGVSRGYMMQIPARRAAVLNIREVFRQRGVYPLPAIDLVSGYPFGLLERRRRYTAAAEVTVYPRVRPVRTAIVDRIPGARFTPRTPTDAGDEFFHIREYVVGDDPRRIAWRVSARVGGWMIRENAQQHARSLIIALEGRLPKELEPLDRIEDRAAYEARYEEAVDLAASLGVSLLRREYEVTFIAPDGAVGPGKGTAQEKRLLDTLARVHLVDEIEHASFAGHLSGQDLRTSAMIYIAPDPRLWVGDGVPARALVADPEEALHG